jgi:hypothetical protein
LMQVGARLLGMSRFILHSTMRINSAQPCIQGV